MSEYTVKDQVLVDKLNAIDKVRQSLTQLAGSDKHFLETIMSSQPQFIVVGAQSAGKSSVLRRISNNSIKLPEAATVCTKVPTVLKLRRNEEEFIQVTVLGPNGFTQEIELENQSPESVSEAISNGQDVAIAFNPEKLFAEDYSIEIKITKKNLPNVTLIDLPGFTLKSDDDTRIVNEMVEKYVSMQGSLVLHVCKSDQDYDTILGNDFLRNTKKEKILVLTHTDRLNAFAVKDYNARLDDTVKSTKEPRFAIIGNHEGSFEEEADILRTHVSIASRPEIRKGTASLNQFIEKQISEHLEHQVPIARLNLETELSKTLDRLELIKEKDATTVMFMATKHIEEKLRNSSKKIENQIRIMQEEFAKLLVSIDIYDLIDNNDYKKIESEHFKYLVSYKNLKIFEQSNTVYFNTEQSNFTKKETNKYYGSEYKDIKLDEYKNCYINYGPINEIISLSKERGLRTIYMQDKQPILVHFAQKFADRYTKINKENLTKTYDYLVEQFDECFNSGKDSASTIALNKLQKIFQAEYKAIYNYTFNDTLNTIRLFNTDPMCYNCLYEYEEDPNIKNSNSSNDDQEGNEEIFKILCEIEKYLNANKFFIKDTSFKHIIIALWVKGRELLNKILKEEMSQVIKYVDDPEDIKSERESLKIRKTILEECVKIIKNV